MFGKGLLSFVFKEKREIVHIFFAQRLVILKKR